VTLRRLAVPLIGLAALVPATSPAAGRVRPLERPDRCVYHREGPPGPRGNRLSIFSQGPIGLYRRGRRILVDFGERCSGPRPTVDNVDRISLETFNEEGVKIEAGLEHLGPAAGRKRALAIRVRSPRLEYVDFGATPDHLLLATLRGHRLAIDTNASRSRRRRFEIIDTWGLPRLTRIYGGGGDDTIDARRVRGIGRIGQRPTRSLALFGEHGNDVIYGSPGRDYRIDDGAGDDLVRAGGGNDTVTLSLGHDRIYGGRGNDFLIYSVFERFGGIPTDASDRLFGGPGVDYLRDDNRRPDHLSCGPGRDEVGPEPHDDPAPDCELRGIRFSSRAPLRESRPGALPAPPRRRRGPVPPPAARPATRGSPR
jgi:hypothetical protein